MSMKVINDYEAADQLCEKMVDAIMAKLLPPPEQEWGRSVELMFRDMDQHTVLAALADTACTLIVYATEAKGWEKHGTDWVALTDAVIGQMRRWAEDDSDLPLPHPRRPKLLLAKR